MKQRIAGILVVLVACIGLLPQAQAFRRDELQLPEMYRYEMNPQRDQLYIFFLQKNSSTGTYEVMFDGTTPWNAGRQQELTSLVRTLPAWSRPQDGIATLLLPGSFTVSPGADLDLWIGYRNETDHPITVTYSDWPRATHSHWKLHVRDEAGRAVAAANHPNIFDDIDEYFSRHGRTYDIKLAPGQATFLTANRVNTAQGGMGFKEDLDFKYYPMAPRTWIISAEAVNLGAFSGLVTSEVRVVVQ
jgi:hypothetical protein